VDRRDQIAELLMAQDAERWAALPQSENVEDRRPYDPLDAYVRQPPPRLQGNYRLTDLTPQEQREFVETTAAGDPYVTPTLPSVPGPMPPEFEMRGDIDQYAASVRGLPPEPTRPAVPVMERRRDYGDFPSILEREQWIDGMDRSTRGGGMGHMDYSFYGMGRPRNPYTGGRR